MRLNKATVNGADIPIDKLVPVRKRTPKVYGLKKLKASIEYSGLIDPLCVFKNEEEYYILDGYLRYTILKDLNVSSVPCLIIDQMDFFTPNKHVNNVSPLQERRMILKALEKVDQEVIAQAFGVNSIRYRLNETILQSVHKNVAALYDEGRIFKTTVIALSHVSLERQLEILNLMIETNDYSAAFVKVQVLKTETFQRAKTRRRKNPWDVNDERRGSLARKLEEAEKNHDFYTGLYRQYSSDLLKMAVYVRSLVNEKKVRVYLAQAHPEELELFESLVAESA